MPPKRGTEELPAHTLLARYLAISVAALGGVEWLLGRTISRMAAAPNLDGWPRATIEALGRAGIWAATSAFFVAAALLVLGTVRLGAEAPPSQRAPRIGIAIFLLIFAVLSVVHLPFSALEWFNASYNVLALIAIWSIGLFAVINARPVAARLLVLTVCLSYTGSLGFFMAATFASPGTSQTGDLIAIVDAGELLAVLSPFAAFLAVSVPHGQWRMGRRWILPVLFSGLFAIANLVDMALNQGFTGVFTIWSVGLRLYLPWPVYAVALLLYLHALLTCVSPDRPKAGYANANRALGLLLLLYAGYRLQIPYQHLLAVLSLALLAGIVRPFAQPVQVAASLPQAQGTRLGVASIAPSADPRR